MLLSTTDDANTLTKFTRAKKVWECYYPLACLTAQARVSIMEAQWLVLVKEFGEAFLDAHAPEHVTTYIHIFVFHFGFFLETYNGIEKFANYALEGKHSTVKRILAYGTSGFSHGPAETARQQLCALLRDELHNEPGLLKPSKKKTWAEATLPKHPSISDYVTSTKMT